MVARFSQVLYSAQHCNWGRGKTWKEFRLTFFHGNQLEIKNSQNILHRIVDEKPYAKQSFLGMEQADETCWKYPLMIRYNENNDIT